MFKLNLIYVFVLIVLSINTISANESEFKDDLFKNTNFTSHWSIFSQPPFHYENNKILYVDVKTSKEALQALVPEQLTINDENKIIFYIGRLHIKYPYPSSYNEGGILIPVTYKDEITNKQTQAYYVPVLYLDETIPIFGGREVYGYNKFYSTIEMNEEENKVKANVVQWGQTLIDIELEFDKPANKDVFSINHGGLITVKRVPSIEQDGSLDVHKLNLGYVREYQVKDKYIGEGQLKLGATEWDPLNKIPVLEIVSASYQTENMILDNGKVIHDYLSE